MFPVVILQPTMDDLAKAVEDAIAGEVTVRRFAVQCKRPAKHLPFNSMEVEREIGARVKRLTDWPVDLEHPELTIRIELVNDKAFLGFGRVDGPGGLPTGVTGAVVCLLSGGIDSPVAAHRILRRGATATYVHFHSYPHTGAESQEKARVLAEKIQPSGRRSSLYLVPFAELQRKIVSQCSAPLRVVLYRRFMVRVAEAIARSVGALALVTGENLGQVASQTLENLRSIEAAARLPMLRPLIGMDKREIIEEARRIGTFEISIEPHGDCCSFLMPPNPATHSLPEELEAEEGRLNVEEEVAALVAASKVVEVGSPKESPAAGSPAG